MRQVFLGSPWIHAPADPDIVRLFNTCGRWAKLPAGGCIFNGGDRGEIALVLSGLGAFSFQDRHGRNHIFTLILPGRLMGDVDGLSGSTVNVTDAALRETEVLLLSRDLFLQFLSENPSIQRKHAVGIIADHESDMEGMIANFTLSAPDRIITLFASLIHNLRPEPDSEGFYPLENSLTTIEISQIVSVARPTVSAILNQWLAEGLLKKVDKHLCVSHALFAALQDWTHRGATPAAKIRKRRHRRVLSAVERRASSSQSASEANGGS